MQLSDRKNNTNNPTVTLTTHYNLLQPITTYYNLLQSITIHYNPLQPIAICYKPQTTTIVLQLIRIRRQSVT